MPFPDLLVHTAMVSAPTDTTDLAPLRALVFAGLRAAGWAPIDIERGRAPLSAHTDEALLAALVRGDAVVFDLLFDRHAAKLNGYARRWLSGADAADAVQESFLVLFQKAEAVLAHGELNVAGFLFGTLRNKVLRTLAKHAREPVSEEPAAEEHALHDDGLAALLRREEAQRLAQLVERTCHPLEQEVVSMTLDDHDGPEIGRTLGISAGHVRVLRHRAFEKLRRALVEEGAS